MPAFGTIAAGPGGSPTGTNVGLGSGLGPTLIAPGDTMVLFNAESPTAPAFSIAVTRGRRPAGAVDSMVFTATGNGTAGVVVIQGSNDYANWQTLYTSSALTNASVFYADTGAFLYYR